MEACSNAGMKSLAHISALGIVGLSLGSVVPVFGQSDQKSMTAGPPNVQPAQPISTTATPAATENPPGVDAVDSTTRASGKREESVGGAGYSWREKKHKSARTRVAARLDPNRPILQAPNFELRSDGTSVITLLMSKTTTVTRLVKALRVEYRLKGAQVGVSNNLNPLVTAHFASPLRKAVLQRRKDGVALVLWLRERIQPLHEIRVGPAGTAMIEVTLPPPRTGQPATGSRNAEPAASRRQPNMGRPRGERRAAKSGPGPGL